MLRSLHSCDNVPIVVIANTIVLVMIAPAMIGLVILALVMIALVTIASALNALTHENLFPDRSPLRVCSLLLPRRHSQTRVIIVNRVLRPETSSPMPLVALRTLVSHDIPLCQSVAPPLTSCPRALAHSSTLLPSLQLPVTICHRHSQLSRLLRKRLSRHVNTL